MSRPKFGALGEIPADHATTAWADETRAESMPVRPAPEPVETTPTPAPPQPKPSGGVPKRIIVERTPSDAVTLSNEEAERLVRALRGKQAATRDQSQQAKLMRSRHTIQNQQRQQNGRNRR